MGARRKARAAHSRFVRPPRANNHDEANTTTLGLFDRLSCPRRRLKRGRKVCRSDLPRRKSCPKAHRSPFRQVGWLPFSDSPESPRARPGSRKYCLLHSSRWRSSRCCSAAVYVNETTVARAKGRLSRRPRPSLKIHRGMTAHFPAEGAQVGTASHRPRREVMSRASAMRLRARSRTLARATPCARGVPSSLPPISRACGRTRRVARGRPRRIGEVWQRQKESRAPSCSAPSGRRMRAPGAARTMSPAPAS